MGARQNVIVQSEPEFRPNWRGNVGPAALVPGFPPVTWQL